MREMPHYQRGMYRFLRAARTVLPFAFFLAVSYFLSFLTKFSTGGSTLAAGIAEALFSSLLLYSTVRLATIGDPELSHRFLRAREPLPARGIESGVFFLHDRTAHVELAVMLSLGFLLPLNFGIFFPGAYFFAGIDFYLLQRLLTLLTSLPLFLIAYLFGKAEAVEFWRNTLKMEKANPLLRGILGYVSVTAVYLLGACYAPRALSLLAGFALFLFAFPALLLVWVAVCLLRFCLAYLRVFRARHRLYRRLRKASAERGYTLTKPLALYRTILFPRRDVINFTLTSPAGEVYDCHVFSTLRKRRVLFFDAEGTVTAVSPARRNTVGLEPFPRPAMYSYYVSAELFSLLPQPPPVSAPYGFTSEHRKLVIVTPAVWRWYVDEGNSREIQPGAFAWGYRFYSATDLLSLLERDALDRDWKHR